MKVLMLAPYSNPLIQRLRYQLICNGIEVVLASFNAKECTVNRIYDLGDLKSFTSYLYSPKIKEIVDKEKPDLVHSHVINHYGILGSAIKGIPKVLTLWGSDVLVAPNHGNFIKRFIFKLINDFVYRRSDVIHSSSIHVIEELNKQVRVVDRKKECVFYWGNKLVALSKGEYENMKLSLSNEFGLNDERLVVFPRGVSKIYSPNNVLSIVNAWAKVAPNRKILIFKAFTVDCDWNDFVNKVDNLNVTFIDRLLSESELSYIYSKSDFHFSLPVSDNLGGGVVEPYQFGSFPVLSDIIAYQSFCDNVNAIRIENYKVKSIITLINYLENNKPKPQYSEEYSEPIIKMIAMYKRLCNV